MANNHSPAGGLRPEYYVRVARQAERPRLWIWAIHQQGGHTAIRTAPTGFRSADEAFEAGRAEFTRLGLRWAPVL